MSDPTGYLWLIPLLPLLASAITALLGPRFLRQSSHIPCIVAVAGSCVLSVMVLLSVYQSGQSFETPYYTWVSAGDAYLPITLRADALTAIMLVMVTFIGSLIAIYAVGYMHHDQGYARFFAEIALFIASMTGLVLASNFILLYACWEGVGVCSYLLIGFWFSKPEAAKAARKAFLVTRLGDIGFLIGILVIWSQFTVRGVPLYTLDYTRVFHAVSDPAFDGPVTLACLLLFCGAVGKSAQFPLHVWLPDAMEGPTPVSALIHAATMVTAGVYMVARCTPLFALAPDVQLLVAGIGGITALLAALIALTQNDLKRVLAYSTLSQLGYMFMALGSATRGGAGHGDILVVMGVTAAMFHLFTHAFFKALLFLAAGSVMHSMGNVIDMRRFGGLRYALKTTHWTFLCGALALSGFPLFAGFWSKDMILGTLMSASTAERPYHTIYAMLFVVGIITAGLTAFYTFRAYFLTFWGEYRVPSEAGEHVHESPPVMVIPLMILAIGAIGVGYLNAEPTTDAFHSFLERTPFLGGGHGEEAGGPNVLVMLGGTLFALGGIGLAAWMYVIRPGLAGRLAGSIQGLYQLSLNKFYIDEIYSFFIVKPLNGIAEIARLFDLYGVDSLVDVLGQVPRFIGLFFRPIQNGLAQFYALAMALGLAAFLVALLWNFAW
jgi:proton-translocating NADH-quinone oxidoreductase chain L